MTVNELMQELVELARDGKGQWLVLINDSEYGLQQINSMWDDPDGEVIIQ